MKNPSSRTRTNGAYVIKSAESRPLAIKATTARHGRSSAATSQDKKLIAAVRQRHKAA